MRKQIINQGSQGTSPADDQEWLDVENLVQVELTSEDAEHPIESALKMKTVSCGTQKYMQPSLPSNIHCVIHREQGAPQP